MGPIAEIKDVHTEIPVSSSCNCFDGCSIACCFSRKVKKHSNDCSENVSKVSNEAKKIIQIKK